MGLKIEETGLDGLKVVTPDVFKDARGYFVETHHHDAYRKVGIDVTFVQDNQSYSVKGVLRGLHAQVKKPQDKLVRAVMGEVFDVAVDVRVGSPTFGKWYGVVLSGENMKQLFIPKGFLHGFCVLGDGAILSYKCSDVFDPMDPFAVMWNDRDLGVEWPVSDPIVSPKDQANMTLKAALELLKEVGSEK
jgi:dTDP-4-dehydrorhamnose 3,5-epimerase